jgi:hypothetical protein
MRGAGFIDIQVRHFKLHVGEWGNDEKERNMGRRGAAIRGGSVAPLMEGMDYFLPDDGERAAFVARVEQELWNPEYHLYTPMYIPALNGLIVGFALLDGSLHFRFFNPALSKVLSNIRSRRI